MDESGIESLFRSNAPGKWEQIKKAASIAQEHRRRVKEGDMFIFLFPLAAAIAKDAIFDFIPIAGTIFGVFITVYLFVFMWGRGRLWLRFVFFIIAVLDLIPVINLIPFNTASVIYAFLRARKDADQSQAALLDMERQAPRLRSKLQSQSARMARAVALREERMNRQAADSASPEAAEGAVAPSQTVRTPQMANFSAPQNVAQRSVGQQVVRPSRSATGLASPAGGLSPSSRMMEGAQMPLAQVRGAANDPRFNEIQPMRQPIVSGSDMVAYPFRREQPMDATPNQPMSSTSSPVRNSSSSNSPHPQRLHESSHTSHDAMTRIREAGSRLAQLANRPSQRASVPLQSVAGAAAVSTATHFASNPEVNQGPGYSGAFVAQNDLAGPKPMPVGSSANLKEASPVPLSLVRSAETVKDSVVSAPPEKVIVDLGEVNRQVEEKKLSIVNEVEHLAGAQQQGASSSLTISKLQEQIVGAQEITSEVQSTLTADALRAKAEAELIRAEPHDAAVKAYEADREVRSVKNIMKRHNAFMVHGIMLNQEVADAVSGENNALRAGVDPRRRIELLTTLSPTLSTTTVRSGYTKEREGKKEAFRDGMWSPFGVFLKGGKVVAASRMDAGSKGEGLLRRKAGLARSEVEAIDDAVTTASDRYNELITESPEVAGLYMAVDPKGRSYSLDKKTLGILSDAVRSKSMPAYALNEKGEAFEIQDVDTKSGQLQLGRQCSPEDVANNSFTLTSDEKRYRAADIIDDAIFDPKSLKSKEDADRYEALQHGRMALVRMMHNQGRQLYDERDGEKIDAQRTIRGLGRETSFIQEEGQLYRKHQRINDRDEAGKKLIDGLDNRWLEIGGMLGGAEIGGEGENVYASPDALESAVKKALAKMDKWESADSKHKGREQLAFFVHGIASEAPWTRDDVPVAERFKALEKSIAPDLDVSEFYRQRVGNDDQFILTREDIE